MTRDEIIDLACEHTVGGLEFDEEGLLRFVEIIAAAEREACAKVCEELGYYAKHGGWGCADAIRARGQE